MPPALRSNLVFSGGSIENRMTCSDRRVPFEARTAMTATAAPRTASVHGSHRAGRRREAAGAAPGRPCSSPSQDSSRARSAALCQRSRGSFARQVAMSRATPGADSRTPTGSSGASSLRDRVHRLDRGFAGERPPARDHLVQHAAERENVGAVVHREPAHLLRRHVGDGPEDHAGLGRTRQRRRSRVAGICGQRDLARQAEVEDLDVAVFRDEDVLGLEVPVDDPLLVCRGETSCDLRSDVERLARRQRSGPQTLPQRLAFEELHERGDVVRPLSSNE